MGIGVILELPVEFIAFIQLLVQSKPKIEKKVMYERRIAGRRRDRRYHKHRRTSISSDIDIDELNRREGDRRNVYADRRRRDRRALERIKKI